LDEGSAFIFALLAFAAGFIVRPFGALVFGRLGDMIGRKYTFLVTILIMGLSTFIVGILPELRLDWRGRSGHLDRLAFAAGSGPRW
jgi:MFS family permease